MTTVHAYVARSKGADLEPFEYELGELGPHQVDIAITHTGICHSDLSMLDNSWGRTTYPLVAGHEGSGTVAAKGELVTHLEIGQRVGLGWYAGSCMHCHRCMHGDHNMCKTPEETIVDRHGTFADRVRASAEWVVPIPDGVDPVSAGPLFCGGVTVFNPIVQFGVSPIHRVGVVGIGGLGHMALAFLRAWGCEVTAFTSSESKMEEAKSLGAHRCVNSRDPKAIAAEAGRFDFIISTVNVPLDWDAYMNALGPRGRLHHVGAVLKPQALQAFQLIPGQKQVSGTPMGSPATTADMLAFCARHEIKPVTETFPIAKINDALEHLREGKARYRVVLEV